MYLAEVLYYTTSIYSGETISPLLSEPSYVLVARFNKRERKCSFGAIWNTRSGIYTRR